MTAPPPTVRLELRVTGKSPEEAFDLLVAGLELGLPRSGIRFESGPKGRLFETYPNGTEKEFARVEVWEPGRRIAFAWHPTDWDPDTPAVSVEYRFEKVEGGTIVRIDYSGLDQAAPIRSPDEQVGWFTSELLQPLIRATTPRGLGDWWTDRSVRRPTGEKARATYADPIYHRPNFLIILERLHLTADDRLLEVGCGGGAFLHDALASGCAAWAVDHSPEMVRLAQEQNRAAIDAGRLEVREADAHHLPFPDALCTCAVSTGAFGFFERPVDVLAEIRRVLCPGGRLVLFSSSKEMKGTPAAPEPFASRIHFYEDDELVNFARAAGLEDVRVDRPEFGRYARAAGLSEEIVAFFETGPRAGQILQARRSSFAPT